MITLIISLIFSLCLNVLLIWYSRRLAKEYVSFVESLSELEKPLIEFQAHLKSIYELETFYGDTTLEGLLRHSKQVVSSITGFYDDYTLEEEEEGLLLDDNS